MRAKEQPGGEGFASDYGVERSISNAIRTGDHQHAVALNLGLVQCRITHVGQGHRLVKKQVGLGLVGHVDGILGSSDH